jgi:uncharacterized protein (DUF433 family)
VAQATKLLGVGIYSVPEAARLTGVRGARIRRWLEGYRYGYRGEKRARPPVWKRDIPDGGMVALSFLDLMEARIVNEFLNRGVSLGTIRAVCQKAEEELGMRHPFVTRQFKSSGRQVFRTVGEDMVYEFLRNQRHFEEVINPFLEGVDFSGEGYPERWWPLGDSRTVVLDPKRSFGKPIVADYGVLTTTLADAVKAEGSEERVALWYEVPLAAVRDAVEFEGRPAA